MPDKPFMLFGKTTRFGELTEDGIKLVDNGDGTYSLSAADAQARVSLGEISATLTAINTEMAAQTALLSQIKTLLEGTLDVSLV